MSLQTVTRSNLQEVVAEYRNLTGKSLAAVSKEVYGQVDFLQRFFDGEQDVSLRKVDDAFEKLVARWPTGADYPFLETAIFPRPQKR